MIRKMLNKANEKRGDIDTADWATLLILPVLFYLVLLVNGVAFFMDCPRAYLGLAICEVAIIGLCIYSAWDMLIWMAMVTE